MQVGLVHGSMAKVCPHTSTGRADYFGTTVNRAARLHVAAKPGQILVEAPVMDTVLQQWRRGAFGSNSSARPGVPASLGTTKGAALLQAGGMVIPDIVVEDADELVMSPRIKSAPQLLRSSSEIQRTTESPGDPSCSGSSLQHVDSGIAVTAGAALDRQTSQAGQKSWFARPPGALRTMPSSSRISRQGVTFAPAAAADRASTGLSKMLGPRRSTEGVSYDDTELDELEATDATCQPVAASSALTVGNCHMLKFLGQYGRQQGRRESVIGPKPALGGSLTPLSGSPELSQASLPAFAANRTGRDNSASSNVITSGQDTGHPGSKRPSFLNPQQRGECNNSMQLMLWLHSNVMLPQYAPSHTHA